MTPTVTERASSFRSTALIGFLALSLAACDNPSTANGEKSTNESTKVEASEHQFKPTADGGYAIGAEDAPVTVVEFASFTCGACANFHTNVFPKLQEKYINSGQVRFEMRSFTRNEPDLYATIAINCAAPHNFEPMADLFFKSQKEWLTSGDPNGFVEKLAKRAGIPSSRYQSCTNDNGQKRAALTVTQQAAQQYQVAATPTVVVNGEVVYNGGVWTQLDAAIQAEL